MGEFRHWNGRKTALSLMIAAILVLTAVAVLGSVMANQASTADFTRRNLAPSWQYLFGTDWLGRDMFARTMAGLSMSIRIGVLTAAVSALIAITLGTVAAVFGKAADVFVSGLIDLVLGIPHILLLVLISFSLGKGFWGVVVGISLTHWTSLARVLRGEIIQLKESQFIKIAEKMGMGPVRIAGKHMIPHILPQIFTGLVLLFSHAILHEASITFLGFGLSSEQPAIGVILSESMKYLTTGKWWLALFPGLFLVIVVLLFHYIGDTLNTLMSPDHVHQ